MADDEQVIPLVEERVAISKAEVETGRLRVRIAIDEREEGVAAELSRDEVEVQRVPRGVPLDTLPEVRVDGDTTIIPVVEEQLVVEKRLVLVEEIHLVRRTESATHEVPVTVRSERAEVERESPSGAVARARWQPK
ncbi:MAG TPA: YsnF/AvaK domain-containing protein [Allosphingosinicella sp.]|jgi:uncharacterized protein (TIGR02271 family)